MAIEIGDVFHPRPGVSQVPVTLGTNRTPNMPVAAVTELLASIPGVKSWGTIGTMWSRGKFDILLSDGNSDKMPALLVARIRQVCQRIVDAG